MLVMQNTNLFSPSFTTSTNLIQITKQVVIMSSFQSYFNFVNYMEDVDILILNYKVMYLILLY